MDSLEVKYIYACSDLHDVKMTAYLMLLYISTTTVQVHTDSSEGVGTNLMQAYLATPACIFSLGSPAC